MPVAQVAGHGRRTPARGFDGLGEQPFQLRGLELQRRRVARPHEQARRDLVTALGDHVHGLVVRGCHEHGLAGGDSGRDHGGHDLALPGTGRPGGDGQGPGHRRPDHQLLALVARPGSDDGRCFAARVLVAPARQERVQRGAGNLPGTRRHLEQVVHERPSGDPLHARGRQEDRGVVSTGPQRVHHGPLAEGRQVEGLQLRDAELGQELAHGPHHLRAVALLPGRLPAGEQVGSVVVRQQFRDQPGVQGGDTVRAKPVAAVLVGGELHRLDQQRCDPHGGAAPAVPAAFGEGDGRIPVPVLLQPGAVGLGAPAPRLRQLGGGGEGGPEPGLDRLGSLAQQEVRGSSPAVPVGQHARRRLRAQAVHVVAEQLLPVDAVAGVEAGQRPCLQQGGGGLGGIAGRGGEVHGPGHGARQRQRVRRSDRGLGRPLLLGHAVADHLRRQVLEQVVRRDPAAVLDPSAAQALHDLAGEPGRAEGGSDRSHRRGGLEGIGGGDEVDAGGPQQGAGRGPVVRVARPLGGPSLDDRTAGAAVQQYDLRGGTAGLEHPLQELGRHGRAWQVVRVGIPGEEVQLVVGLAELPVPAEVEEGGLAGLPLLQKRLDGVQHLGAGRLGDHGTVVVHADLGVLEHRLHVVQVGPDGREVVVALAVVRGHSDQHGVPVVVTHSAAGPSARPSCEPPVRNRSICSSSVRACLPEMRRVAPSGRVTTIVRCGTRASQIWIPAATMEPPLNTSPIKSVTGPPLSVSWATACGRGTSRAACGSVSAIAASSSRASRRARSGSSSTMETR